MMRDVSDEYRTASWGEHAYISNLNDDELDEFIRDVEEKCEECSTLLVQDYLNIALFEKESREMESER